MGGARSKERVPPTGKLPPSPKGASAKGAAVKSLGAIPKRPPPKGSDKVSPVVTMVRRCRRPCSLCSTICDVSQQSLRKVRVEYIDVFVNRCSS